MERKRAKIRLKEYLRKLDENTKDLPMSKESSPIINKTTQRARFNKMEKEGRIGMAEYNVKKFSSGELADLIGPSKPKGSVSPKFRAYDDEFQSEYGAGVNLTTKKGVSFDIDVDKTEYKGTDYKEPESYSASVSKQGDKLSYGVSGKKKGKAKSIEAGFTFKYKHGGMSNCRGMGKAIKGGKFTGVK
jgi:hypothetical protein